MRGQQLGVVKGKVYIILPIDLLTVVRLGKTFLSPSQPRDALWVGSDALGPR